MRLRWLAPGMLLLVAAAAVFFLAPFGPVLREARESSLLLPRLLAARRLEGHLAVLSARLTANTWSWPPQPGEQATPWQRCDERWPCRPSVEPLWVLRPSPGDGGGVESALLLRCPKKGCLPSSAEIDLRVRSIAGERRLELFAWRPPDLSPVGGGWLEGDSPAPQGSGDAQTGCDLSARLLGHRAPRADCDGPPPREDEAWLRRVAERVPGGAVCEPRETPEGPLVWVPARAVWSCGEPVQVGSLHNPALVVVDLPASIEPGSALEVVGVLLLRRSAEPDAALRVAGRLSVRGLLAVEGKLDPAGELRIEPDAKVLARLGSRTLWRPIPVAQASETHGGE